MTFAFLPIIEGPEDLIPACYLPPKKVILITFSLIFVHKQNYVSDFKPVSVGQLGSLHVCLQCKSL